MKYVIYRAVALIISSWRQPEGCCLRLILPPDGAVRPKLTQSRYQHQSKTTIFRLSTTTYNKCYRTINQYESISAQKY